ncbi:AtpZ/AtpI family protein [Gemmatimonas phototrophica]|nr:AtpZ/AtpI family protein [Gemmatimonas phototrophica]
MDETPKKPTRDSKPQSDDVSPWALAGLGTQFFGSILLFVWVGNWLDHRFDTAPLFLLGGVLVGGGGTFYLSYRQLTKPRRPDPDHHDSTPRP